MPYFKFTIDTALSVDDACSRLRGITRAPRGFQESLRNAFNRGMASDGEFIGRVETASFRLCRNIQYRNSFLPVIHGRLIPSLRGTRVNVTMFLHPLVAVFMLFWLGGVGYGAWQGALRSAGAATLIPFGMIIFGLGLTAGGFFPEALKAKRLLKDSLASARREASPEVGVKF